MNFNWLFISLSLIIFHLPASGQDGKEGKVSGCLKCEELQNMYIPDVWNLKSEVVNESSTYCKLSGTISKEINFELLLPDHWNERFVMGGGGGFVGSIQNVARYKVHEGYATVGTDTGHKGSGIKADWGYNHMERQLNYGYLAVHRTAEVAAFIIAQYYCQPSRYSYFVGCSRGGGQAMHEAQKYPDDFDGLVAAAPVISFTASGAEFIQNVKALYPDPNSLDKATLSAEHIRLLAEEVERQCDQLDGIKDHILNDPTVCDFKFEKLPRCSHESVPTDHCFTDQQIEIVKAIYNGPESEGVLLYPGFPFGAEAEKGGWMSWIVGPDPGTMQLNFPSLQYAFGTEMYKYLVFSDPNWDYSTFDLSEGKDQIQYAAAYLDATSTDYTGFKERGGKLLFYHGWNDPALSALTTIQHYEEVEKKDAGLRDFMRLFLLPGVLHCGGGPGPSSADWLEIVRDWVENGHAPDKIIVSKSNDGSVPMTRPVFPYPSVAKYNGTGDIMKAESFSENKN